MSNSSFSHPKYRPDIDGLRAIAVLSVVVFHAFPSKLQGGFIGVDVFFVISGFLISTIIFQNLDKGTFSFSEFYSRRIKRIFPALFLVLGSCFIFGWFALLSEEFKQLGKHIAAGSAFISNFVLWSEVGYFDNSAETKPLLHLWSLGIEEQFYIFWPLLLWIGWKLRLNLLLVTIVVAIISFVLNILNVVENPTATFFSPITRAWELLFGTLLAWITLYRKESIVSKINEHKVISNVFSIVGISLLGLGFLTINKSVAFPGFWAVIPVLGTVFIIAAGPQAWINKFILSNKIVVWFGLISFPLYLWHWPLLTLGKIVSVETLSIISRLILVLLSIILAWITFKLIEKPFRSPSHSKAKVIGLIVAMSILGLLGLKAFLNNGFESREIVKHSEAIYSKEAREYEEKLTSSFKNYSGSDLEKSNKPVILILGDSYNKKWSVALSQKIDLDKYDVVSATYLECKVDANGKKISAVATAKEYAENCEKFESLVNNQAVVDKVSAVMLTSHRPFEYEVNPFRFDIIRNLKAKNSNFDFFVFGGYFQLDGKDYSSCKKLMMRSGRNADICLENAVYPVSEPKIEAMPFYPKDLNFKYIDIIKLHCSYDKKNCATQYNGVPFMDDWNHLNVTFLSFLLDDIRSKNASQLDQLGLLKYLKN
ncbi:MAG TPA: acyltransferase [Acinetobacter radioresistens]|uniref:Acyltransferase n=1 Tax=Acinetobacter radioresistens TaxID=40216 RepID=A0A3D3G280_ACIRA|nr:acyltransferase [Acinetobacter radioresistens]